MAGSAGPKTSETGYFRLLSASARNRAAIEKGAIAIDRAGGRRRGWRPGPRRRRTSGESDSFGYAGTPATPRRRPAVGAWRRRRRWRLHDRSALRRQGAAGGQRRGCVLRVPLQRVRAEVRGAQGEGREAEPLPPFALKGVKITFNVDADYTIVRTRLTHNVVGIVEGSDPKLKDTYVAYGAHYDHTATAKACPVRPRRAGAGQS